MSLLVRSESYDIHITTIATDDSVNRRHHEQAATAALIREVFGPDASLIHSPEGAPRLASAIEIPISISHSANHCILAIGKVPYINIGVDIETPRHQLLRIARRFLCDRELETVVDLPDEASRLQKLLGFWTAKEAVYKASLTPGLGLKEIVVNPDFSKADARGRDFRLCRHRLPTGEEITVALGAD